MMVVAFGTVIAPYNAPEPGSGGRLTLGGKTYPPRGKFCEGPPPGQSPSVCDVPLMAAEDVGTYSQRSPPNCGLQTKVMDPFGMVTLPLSPTRLFAVMPVAPLVLMSWSSLCLKAKMA